MRVNHSTQIAQPRIAALCGGLLAFAGAFAADEPPSPSSPYTWSAELVAFDQAASTVTVKARRVETTDRELKLELDPGERAMLTWSGISTAAGIRDIEPGETSSYDRMTLPVEYVGSELDGRYVSFKVPVPAEAAAKLSQLAPGQWVTATSPHRPQSAQDAVVSIRPYNDIG